jgi:hypothetical protein
MNIGKGWKTLRGISEGEIAERIKSNAGGCHTLEAKVASIVFFDYDLPLGGVVHSMCRTYRLDEPDREDIARCLLAIGCTEQYAKKRSVLPKIKGRLKK